MVRLLFKVGEGSDFWTWTMLSDLYEGETPPPHGPSFGRASPVQPLNPSEGPSFLSVTLVRALYETHGVRV